MSEIKSASGDNSLSTFMFGLTVGIVGALLLGTKEGQKITKQLLSTVSEGIDSNSDLLENAKKLATSAVTQIGQYTKSETYLPDQPTKLTESPPPPPPYIQPTRSNSSFPPSQNKTPDFW